MSAKIDLTGMRFGKLVAIRETSERKGGRILWLLQCDCGNKHKAKVAKLRNGTIKSCGCLRGAHLRADYDCLNGVY